MNKRSDFWLFLRVFPSMLLFQLLVVAMMLGILFAVWFYAKFVDATQERSLPAVLYTIIVSMLIIIYGCYQAYSGKGGVLSDYKAAAASLQRELIVVAPLLVGAILTMYLLMNGQFGRIGLVLWPAILLWLILRFIFWKSREEIK